MKFSTSAVLAVLSASTAFAAPAADPDVSMMTTSQWTIQNMKRTCGGGTCSWSFGINQNDGNAATSCAFKVNGSPATQTDSSGNKCGKYTVSTGWSGQFGQGQGFTTLSVVDNNSKQIIYPAYTDKQLSGGKVVKPDQKYTPQNLPK